MKKKAKPETASTAPPLRLEWRSPQELKENPANWRRHPEAQMAALEELVGEVGWAGACLYNERTGRLIDGHARREIGERRGDAKIPVLIGSWDEETEKKILSTLDPIGELVDVDQEALERLLAQVNTQGPALDDFLNSLSSKVDDEVTRLQKLTIRKPPRMTWVLVGIPTVQYDKIAGMVEDMARLKDVVLETTSNDGERAPR